MFFLVCSSGCLCTHYQSIAYILAWPISCATIDYILHSVNRSRLFAGFGLILRALKTHSNFPSGKDRCPVSLLLVASLKLAFSPEARPLKCGPDLHLERGKLWPKPWSGRVLRLAFLTSFVRTVLLEVKCRSFVIWLSALQRLGNSRPIKGINVSRARHIYCFVLIITCCIHASHCNSVPLKDAQILCHME